MHYTPRPKERAMALSIVDGVMTLPDLRQLCITDSAYVGRTCELSVRQEWKCAMCDRIMGYPTFDHEAGRGSGGSRQDDSLTHEDGTWKNAALCAGCNGLKGSRRFRWVDGRYQEV